MTFKGNSRLSAIPSFVRSPGLSIKECKSRLHCIYIHIKIVEMLLRWSRRLAMVQFNNPHITFLHITDIYRPGAIFFTIDSIGLSTFTPAQSGPEKTMWGEVVHWSCSRSIKVTEPLALRRKAATDKLAKKIVKHGSWPIQPDILNPPLLRLTSRKPLWLDFQPIEIKSRWRHNWKSAQVVNSHLVCDPTIRQLGFDLPRQQWSVQRIKWQMQ